MRVGELARRTGVGVSTLRAWERRFHFLEPQRSPAGQRLYEESDVERVEAVLRVIAEGLTLSAAIARVSLATAAPHAGEAEALLYDQILQAVGEGIWVIRDGRTLYANWRMAEIMGCSVGELASLPMADLFDPADLPLVQERTTRARSGHRLRFVQELRRPDGTTFLAEVNTTPLVNRAGGYEGSVALDSDITTRHDAETQTRLRATILDSIGEAVTASTADGTLVYVNGAAERLFGWHTHDVLGRDNRDVFSTPGSDPKVGARILASLLRGRAWSGRYRMSRHDGSQFVAHVTATPTRGADDELVGYVGVVRDQTEPDRLERELRARERQAETLALLGAQALGRSDTQGASTLLAEVAQATRRLLQADRAAVLEIVATEHHLVVRADSPALREGLTLPLGSGSFTGYVALAAKVIVVDDIGTDRRFDPHPLSATLATSAAIGAPIFGEDGVKGVLIAASSTPSRFRQEDAHFIQGMANIVASALRG
jgi:PAS domain S-box-containing protein